MSGADPARSEAVVRGKRRTVTAVKLGGAWKATGTCRGGEPTADRAATPARAFEWRANKAQTPPST
jgi:hypothetical protein